MTQQKSKSRSSSRTLSRVAEVKDGERRVRAMKLLAYLKQAYPVPKTELVYTTPIQLVVAVMLSAQCTDKAVNRATASLFKKLHTPADFASVDRSLLETNIGSITYYRAKAKHIIATAQRIEERFGGIVPHTAHDLQSLPGIGYKTAHVVLGELFDVWEGIATDTHVKRFARRFDLTDHTGLEDISHDLEALVSKSDWKYVNNGFVLYGRYVCKARPHHCEEHALTKIWPEAATRWPR